MKKIWILSLLCLVLSHTGCGKKQDPEPVVRSKTAAVQAALPVLEQNKIAPNPAFMGSRDIVPQHTRSESEEEQSPAKAAEDSHGPPTD